MAKIKVSNFDDNLRERSLISQDTGVSLDDLINFLDFSNFENQTGISVDHGADEAADIYELDLPDQFDTAKEAKDNVKQIFVLAMNMVPGMNADGSNSKNQPKTVSNNTVGSKLTFLNEGDKIYIQGSGKNPYEVKKVGGIVSCDCPAWRNFGGTLDTRTCKHIKANVDPGCLLPQSAAVTTKVAKPVRLTKTGKISKAVKGVVVKENAPPCLLAHDWEDEDPTGWWMSEKMDGVRAWWDGNMFVSRNGNEFHAPDWFKKLLPADIVLDGELWIGRDKFSEAISVVRKLIPNDKEWQSITFLIFDAPKHSGKFEERYAFLTSKFPVMRRNGAEGIGQVAVLEQKKCEGEDHLKTVLKEIEAIEGEGVMIRQPGSEYESGKSSTCLKVKSYYDDEAIVTGYTKGEGRHKGRVGALVCSWKGLEIEVGGGLKDVVRKDPPKIGSKITFRYTQIIKKSGIPRFARFLCVRDYE